MSLTKRISGDYTIQSIDASDKININTSLVTINGNLVVTGATAAIETTNTNIWDNIVTLNAGTSPGTPPTLDAGLLVDRGTQANVSIIWSEANKKWQTTNDGTTYGNILLAGIPTGNINITGVALYDTANVVTAYTGTVSGGGSGVYVDNGSATQQELVTKSKALAFSIIFG